MDVLVFWFILDGYLKSRDIDILIGEFSQEYLMGMNRFSLSRFLKRDLDNKKKSLDRVIAGDSP
jgi:hypothetical protein